MENIKDRKTVSRSLKRIAAALLGAMMIFTAASCDNVPGITSTATEEETIGTGTTEETKETKETKKTKETPETEETEFDVDVKKAEEKAKDFINMNNFLYNQGTPYLYIAPPAVMNTEERAFENAVTKKLEDYHYIDILDMSDFFSDAGARKYDGTDIWKYDASLEMFNAINEQIFDYYTLQRGFTDETIGKYVKLDTAKVKDDNGTSFDYTYPKYVNYRSPCAVAYGNVKGEFGDYAYIDDLITLGMPDKDDATIRDIIFGSKQNIVKTRNKWGSGTIVVVHNLSDDVIPTFFALMYQTCVFINVDGYGYSINQLITSCTSSIHPDLVVSMIDPSKEYKKLYNSDYDISAFKGNPPGYIKDNNRVIQLRYEYIDTTPYLPNVLKLRDAVEAQGGVFAYIQPPFKILEGGITILPDNFKDETNKTATDFLKMLEKNGVNTFDIRQAIIDSGVDASEFFLKTEHHWSHTGAFFGYTALIDYFRDTLKIPINKDGYFSDINNYNVDVYKGCMYSYYASGFKQSFCGADKITLIYPKKEMRMTLQYSSSTRREGNFYDTIFDPAYLKDIDTIIQKRYQCYTGNDTDMVTITNKDAECDKSILIIKDSFALPVSSWLSQNFSKVVMFDARSMKTTATNYLKTNKFDYVIVFYNPSIYKLVPAMFKF